jgi:hypothetical protein
MGKVIEKVRGACATWTLALLLGLIALSCTDFPEEPTGGGALVGLLAAYLPARRVTGGSGRVTSRRVARDSGSG